GWIELRNRDRKTVGWARVHGLESDSLRLNRAWSALLAFEQDLVGKPVSTFPDHALALTRRCGRPQSVVSDEPEALGDRKDPGEAGGDQRQADGGRAHIPD